jgi:hypothetical protein
MIEYVMLSLPSLVAGCFAFAWWMEKEGRRRDRATNAVLKAAVTEAVKQPARFQARVSGSGSRVASRETRIAAIREQRKAARAQKAE